MDLKHLKTKLKKAAAKKEADGGEANVSVLAGAHDAGWWFGLHLTSTCGQAASSQFTLSSLSCNPNLQPFPQTHHPFTPTPHPNPKTHHPHPPTPQTLESDIARWSDEIPASEAATQQLAAELSEAEARLEALQEGIKDEVEAHHQALARVKAELAPWEKQMQEVQGRMDVATSERDMLLRKSEDAKVRALWWGCGVKGGQRG